MSEKNRCSAVLTDAIPLELIWRGLTITELFTVITCFCDIAHGLTTIRVAH